ncbi:hypothetical protein SAMN05444320_10393 [Streptoalloteichus hindustanus]|uniref:Uncharacterized protein n=1 Tax=Streptoalloteichus hindustanus TaxID=2017 RepID=A0A1M5AFM4_STRHI|nr:hypothetical protein SAMN05444320_10393 [Streptoalloteichus hindustanus]
MRDRLSSAIGRLRAVNGHVAARVATDRGWWGERLLYPLRHVRPACVVVVAVPAGGPLTRAHPDVTDGRLTEAAVVVFGAAGAR